jgi:FkbM family methyltransferase
MKKSLERIAKWIRYQIRKIVRPQTVNNGGLKLYLGEHAATSYARSIYRDSHEAEEREIVQRHLDDDDTVLECGAGLGAVTILCCRRIGSDRVHTFEANPALEPILRRNFELNRVAPHLQIKLVGMEAGSNQFFVDKKFVTSSRFETNDKTARKPQTVSSISLQTLIDTVKPSFLIMDTEGAEVDLASKHLDLGSLKKICIEMHPQIVGNEAITGVIGRLIEQGFTLHLRDSKKEVLYFSRVA